MDIQSLTISEISLIEGITGQGIDSFDADKPKGKFLQAIAYIIKRRDDSAYTFDMAGELTMAEISALMGTDDSPES